MKKYLVILFFIAGSFAIAQEYKFIAYGQEEGLPQPYVYDIVQGPRGRLYVATGDGLAVFGGLKFKKFTKKDGLSENYCSALLFDSKNRLWIGHFEGGISYKRAGSEFKFDKLSTANFPMARVVSFAEDSKHNVYYATSAGGLYVINDTVVKLFTEEELPPINEIKIKDDVLYVASQDGVLEFNVNKSSRSSNSIEATKGKNITCLEVSARNELWCGVEGVGVEIFSKEGTGFKSVKTYSTELKSENSTVKDICLRGGNEVWISLTGDGLRMIRYNSSYYIDKLNIINGRNGLHSQFINKIFIDKEENFWFGTTGSGLFQFLSSRFELFNTNNFLPFDDIRTVAVDDSDNVFACDDKNVFAFNVNGKLSTLHNLIPKGQEEEIRTSFLNKLTNELWVGTTKNLNVFNIAGNKMIFKSQLPVFKDKTINYITKDQTGRYLICTTEGLFYLNQKLEVEKVFTTNEKAPHNNFLGVLSDRTDKLWVYSPETPLYNVYNDEVELDKDLDSNASFRFSGGVQGRDEEIWFATEGDGIFSYKKNRNPKFKHFNTDDGLSSDFIYGIILTNKGDVIASHKNGISIKYSNLKTFRIINKSNGLPANNINANAMFKDKKGNIWMGSTEGLIKYTPSEDKININPPVFSFVSITADSVHLSVEDTLHNLKYKKYELVIDFIGVSLTNPKGVTYRYMLEGYEEKFRTTSEQSITYPSLEDGNYRFVIFAKNADGFETSEPAVFNIHIKKPFWKEIWFIALFILTTIGLVYLVFKIRTKKLQQAKVELEGLVMEKTAELVLEKEKIEKSNELLNEKNQDITASIAYAKRIQNAVLPHSDYINNILKLFVLYIPRDIVSGDFYWYAESEAFVYVAVVDCTGHGVPGAFMSLLGSTFLDQVLIENKDATPSKMLNELDKKLGTAFRQNDEENRIGDGMDGIILRVNKKTQEVMFSGANRPLYFYSKSGPQDFKSTIYSIGGAFPNDVKGFADISLDVEAGDCCYMFSDGYGDQFGGEKNKRYSTKRMKAFMEELSKHPINEQHKIINKDFHDWKGEYEQMDDICVIGIQF